jgi:hypothetical protein
VSYRVVLVDTLPWNGCVLLDLSDMGGSRVEIPSLRTALKRPKARRAMLDPNFMLMD